MNRPMLFIQILCLIGCSVDHASKKSPKRFLYFTSKFPPSVHWEIHSSFTTKKDLKYLCKDFSLGLGKWVQITKYEHQVLSASNDTLKVPLYWTKSNFCDYELSGLSIGLEGPPMRMGYISLREKGWDEESRAMPLPDSLAYRCNFDSSGVELRCEPDDGSARTDFMLDDTKPVNRIRIDIKGI